VRQNWLEWAVLGLSVVVIVALVGYLAVTAVSTATPPAISVVAHAEEARSIDAGWEVPVIVRNDGGEAAAAIAIDATATVAGVTETAQLEVDLLGPGTEEELVLRFSAAPDGELELRVVGYSRP
jgi:uncharacterized protein (TIGR02588 family)